MTRVSTLEQMAFTSTSEADAGMLTMSEVVRSLRRRVPAAGPRVPTGPADSVGETPSNGELAHSVCCSLE